MENFEEWMSVALTEARSCGSDVPIGCVIVKDNQIIATGRNKREKTQDPTAHAEMLAIREASQLLQNWRLSGCTLVCTLEPCPMCAETILQSRVDRLVFGAYDLVYGAAGSAFNLLNGRTFPAPVIIGGIKEQECRELIQHFFQQIRAAQRSSE